MEQQLELKKPWTFWNHGTAESQVGTRPVLVHGRGFADVVAIGTADEATRILAPGDWAINSVIKAAERTRRWFSGCNRLETLKAT